MFFTRYEELCKGIGKSTSGVGIELGIAKSTITYWRANNSVIPKQDVLLKIANYFGVSVDYLLGDEKDDTEALKFALWGGDAEIVDEDMLEDVRDFAKMLAEKKKRKMRDKNDKKPN